MKTTQKKITQKNYLNLDYKKSAGLLTAIVQDTDSRQVLMVGYMNQAAVKKTLATKRVTFFSRTRNALWTKGETSKNFLNLVGLYADCDNDALLVLAQPEGPTCHTGTPSCFVVDQPLRSNTKNFSLADLETIIAARKKTMPKGSYTTTLFADGLDRIAQKVGEEGVEVIIAARGAKQRLVSESADLLYHLLVLLVARGLSLEDVMSELAVRHAKKK